MVQWAVSLTVASMSAFLFVYGTLASHAEHAMHRQLAGHAEHAGEGWFNGRLYDIGAYPGAVLSAHPDDKVFGELYRLNDLQVLAVLDDYEGCGANDPPPTEFVRRQETIHLEDGTRAQAWIYLFSQPVTDLPRIMSGRYSDQQAER